MKIIKTLLMIMLCISLPMGCTPPNPTPPNPINGPGSNVTGSNDNNGDNSSGHKVEYEVVYSPIKIKYAGSRAEKWMRDNGYTIKKDNRYYHFIWKDRISKKISVVANYIDGSLYDKYGRDVGTLYLTNGEISIEITSEGKVVRK